MKGSEPWWVHGMYLMPLRVVRTNWGRGGGGGGGGGVGVRLVAARVVSWQKRLINTQTAAT